MSQRDETDREARVRCAMADEAYVRVAVVEQRRVGRPAPVVSEFDEWFAERAADYRVEYPHLTEDQRRDIASSDWVFSNWDGYEVA